MPTVKSVQELRDACHHYIGRVFRDQHGKAIGVIRRTVIEGDVLLAVVTLNAAGRRTFGTPHCQAPVLMVKQDE